ncbi:hypothetical protein [Roseospira goensis]|uniref:Uncharacterized protein n=1 Tax=Roseospira goensis TaxID=391922 RepID=A0A7W6WJ83_9PROT|nr:hypothetical protein [Roseospira goensis]MBB4284926.1 hypothetical protein [Roseospira goensis]
MDGRADGGAESAEDAAGPTLTVSEDEARACAARLEPMAASFPDPTEALYLRRLGETAFQVWAPRGTTPDAPLQPWCITTLTAIAETSFLDATNRATVMKLVAGAGPEPPPARAAAPAPEATPAPAPTVVLEETEEAAPRGLPAAFQRLPPRGGRSAPTVGIPVAADGGGLPDAVSAGAAACRAEGGQPTAVFTRLTGEALAAACRRPDGTETPLPALAAHLGATAAR